jgi:hypothetical protein
MKNDKFTNGKILGNLWNKRSNNSVKEVGKEEEKLNTEKGNARSETTIKKNYI